MSFKSASFLEKYDTILFDMDGVITSEEMYWKAAALTVYEFLHSKNYYGSEDIVPSECMKRADELRAKYFCNDKTIKFVKEKGINNNWDLAYIVLAVSFHLDTENFEDVLTYLINLDEDRVGIYKHAEELLAEELCLPNDHVKLHGAFWTDIQHSFQEWFLGNKIFPLEWFTSNIQQGKTGLMYLETPVIDKEKLRKMLSELSKTHTLGIGTGRPYTEAINALEVFDIRKYFDETRIVSHTYMTNLEEKLKAEGKDVSIIKPHPFVFLKGTFGKEASDYDLIDGKYDKEKCKRTLVIGDALCDLYAAKAGGCDFAAVLTGVQGKDAKAAFEKENATYILDDVLCLAEEI